MMIRSASAPCLMFLIGGLFANCVQATQPRLPGTAEWSHASYEADDLATEMVAGIDRFLLAETAAAVEKWASFWNRDFSSAEAYQKSIEPQRERLKWILGIRDQREPFEAPTLDATLTQPAEIGTFARDGEITHRILRITWPVVGGIVWEGVLYEPVEPVVRNCILLPDAGESPRQVLAINPQHPTCPIHLKKGWRVILPAVISRVVHPFRRVELTDREFIYRTSFELGRTPIGYEVQAVLGLVDWLEKSTPKTSIHISGKGDGGRIAMFAAAVDPRIDSAEVSGYFGPRDRMWTEPLDRNLFGFLEQFGDAEIASMIFPRPFAVDYEQRETETIATKGGGPGTLQAQQLVDVEAEALRAVNLVSAPFNKDVWLTLGLGQDDPPVRNETSFEYNSRWQDSFTNWERDHVATQARLVKQITAHNMQLLAESADVRKEFFKELDVSSLETFEATVEPYREYFRKQVIGEFERELLPASPQSRFWKETDEWTGYQVSLDVFPEVFAYGILLVPKDIPAGEQRPVVVCQHGLEGIPEDTIENDHRAYHDFAAKLAEKGYVVFAPQNPYRGKDTFRTLQRKANPLGKTLFSIIVPQHQQITDWLGSLEYVDKERIAFYGLSYGGKTAMRVPPLVDNYCLSICSADFNDWIAKNVSVTAPFSYVGTGEYEIWEFDLGNTFNYAEMATLIAPRPFMVERGHFDGVGPDEWVASEFAKIRFLYNARLKLTDLAEIEFFVGPHAINAQGTFEFLDKHLGEASPSP